MTVATAGIHLGFEVGTGAPVSIPLRHMVVTGQTQEAGKTTALEALIARSGVRAICFITKRGEGSFQGARIVEPYFREQADWQFVASILEASRGEKLRIERAWIIRASKGARTLADVHHNVKKALADPKQRGMSADMYLTLDAYLEVVVPQISRVRWASRVELAPGVSAMDLTALEVEMQHLVIRSTIDWVLKHEEDTVVVVPEAWKFIPEGRGTPVKLAAESFIRQAAGLRNYLWLDSQDIAGVEKKILKSVPVWILGVQRESNEVKRTLAQIPANIRKPSTEAVQTLGLGEFFACYGKHIIKVYVQPEWMGAADAEAVARGEQTVVSAQPSRPRRPSSLEVPVNEAEARALREENRQLREQLAELTQRLEHAIERTPTPIPAPPPAAAGNGAAVDEEGLYQRITQRLQREAPMLLRVLAVKPELEVQVTRARIEIDGSRPKGRIARLIAKGWFDGDGKTQGATRSELARTGADVNSGNISTIFSELLKDGFLTVESGNLYRAVPDTKVNIVDRS